MLSTTPSHSSSGWIDSLASSTTSSACSTPWSEKYSASLEISAWSAAASAFTVSRPSDGGQSISTRSYWRLALAQRALERQLAAHLAAQHQLGLGQPEVGGQHAPSWIASTARAWPPSTSATVGEASAGTSK